MKQQKLTTQEAAFAAEHHDLIFRYILKKGLSEDEYYDVLVFGYLRSVRRYLRNEELRRYSFSSIAWRAMDSSYSHYLSYKTAAKRNASVLCLHEPDHNAYTLEETIADVYDMAEDVIQRISAAETMKAFDATERRIVALLAEGYRFPEIAETLGIAAKALDAIVSRMETKSRPLVRAA